MRKPAGSIEEGSEKNVMETFHLQIVTMDGPVFDGQVKSISFRSIHGDLAIRARHCNYCTAIGMGTARIILEDDAGRSAACIGGMVSVMDGQCRLLPTTWEWSGEIDVERAEHSLETARKRLETEDLSDQEKEIVQARLRRALVRIDAAGKDPDKPI